MDARLGWIALGPRKPLGRIRLSGGLPATELDREPLEGLAALVHLAVGGRVLGECERAVDRGQVRRDPQRPDEGQVTPNDGREQPGCAEREEQRATECEAAEQPG